MKRNGLPSASRPSSGVGRLRGYQRGCVESTVPRCFPGPWNFRSPCCTGGSGLRSGNSRWIKKNPPCRQRGGAGAVQRRAAAQPARPEAPAGGAAPVPGGEVLVAPPLASAGGRAAWQCFTLRLANLAGDREVGAWVVGITCFPLARRGRLVGVVSSLAGTPQSCAAASRPSARSWRSDGCARRSGEG